MAFVARTCRIFNQSPAKAFAALAKAAALQSAMRQ